MTRSEAPGVAASAGALLALLLLTAGTVTLAFADVTPAVQIAAALAFSTVKALLIAVFFMHMSREDRVVRVMVLGASLLLSVLAIVVVVDIFNI